VFAVPTIQLLIFSYAVTTDVRHIATAIYDLDNTVASRDFISRFEKSTYFDIVEYVASEARSRELLDRGEVRAVFRLDKGFEEALRAGQTASVQMLLDGTDSNTAGIVLGYSNKIVQQFAQVILEGRLQRLQGRVRQPGRVELQTRAWFNENLESRNYFVPGIMAVLVMLVTLMLTGMSIVREKEVGTIEQIMVTPIRPVEFILGKCAPFIVIGFVDVLLVTAVGVFWFEVPIRGSLWLLLASTSLYLLSTLGIGLFISTVSSTQQQAMMTTFFFFFPAMLLSGFIYPIANMPRVIQWITLANPLRHFLIIIRGVFLKGVGAEVLWPQMAALLVIGLAVMTFAVNRFHKTL